MDDVVERMSHVEAGEYSPAACGSLLVTPTGVGTRYSYDSSLDSYRR